MRIGLIISGLTTMILSVLILVALVIIDIILGYTFGFIPYCGNVCCFAVCGISFIIGLVKFIAGFILPKKKRKK